MQFTNAEVEMNRILLMLITVGVGAASHPNIVFILTDDQDIVLGGEFPLTKSRQLIADQGLTFINAFASTPICCPSRSTILTGLYLHNHLTVNNSLSGHCSSLSWQRRPEKHSFATYLKKQNYTTFYAGKYLNQYGDEACGGVAHVPPGWDHWFGLKGNSRYYNYTLSVNGKAEFHGDNPKTDYLTDVISKRATEFLSTRNKNSDPFFMMLATPACHAPFTPNPKYANVFSGKRAPRSRNFNVSGNPTKHWLLRQAHALTQDTADFMDKIFRNRWRTLLSVDDMVENVIDMLASKDLLNNTYVMLSSDHGFHLGQFSLPYDKRQLYEEDIRIPLMVRGPGIAPKRISEAAVVTTDFAPTFVDLAGLSPPTMDGISFVPLLKKPHQPWRTSFLVEYQGEGKAHPNPECPQFGQGGVTMCAPECICEDAWNNTYTCLRTMTDSQSTMFCQFEDHENFLEFYNLNLDPYQLDNLAFGINRSSVQVIWKLKELQQFQNCNGQMCISM